MTEPIGDPASVSVLDVNPAAALSVISAGLAAPYRDAVQVVRSLLERTQGSGGIAGFRNRNLVSTHYLRDGFRRDHQLKWIDLDNEGALMRASRGAQICFAR